MTLQEVREPDEAARPRRPSEVRGLIDNASADRLFGWVWDAAYPEARLQVALRLGGEMVASTIADLPRPDLAQGGIGDGCHAFEFPLRPAWIERGAELAAFTFGGDGGEVPVPMRLRRAKEVQLSRTAEAMLREQQAIRAELAALRARTATLPDMDAVTAIATAQQELARKVEQLELWLTRLDGRLDEHGGQREASAEAAGRLDPWQAVLIAVAASAASAALGAIVAHRFLGL